MKQQYLKQLKFSEEYFKLELDEFTTIRGKNYPLFEGDVVEIVVKGAILFKAKVTGIYIRKIKDISLSLLQIDGEYPGYEIHSHDDFLKLLRRFWRYQKIDLETEVKIIFLKKIEEA